MKRRDFLKSSALTGGSLALWRSGKVPEDKDPFPAVEASGPALFPAKTLPDLAPARWIWYPSGRCLANTFVLFRRVVTLPARPKRATGWISAESRYKLDVNGRRDLQEQYSNWSPLPIQPGKNEKPQWIETRHLPPPRRP